MWPRTNTVYLLLLQTPRVISQTESCRPRVQETAPVINVPPYPIINATDSSNAVNSTCEVQCVVYPPKLSMISWVPRQRIVYTTQITVGIISTTIFMDSNAVATSIRSHFDHQWSGSADEMLPPYLTTKEERFALPTATVTLRTVWAMAAFTHAGTTTELQMASPHMFVDYASQYSWEGILPKTDIAGTGNCHTETANRSMTYHTELTENHEMYPQPKPSDTPTCFGYNSTEGSRPLWVPLDALPGDDFFCTAFSSETALSHCEPVLRSSPAPTTFYTPEYLWDHATVTIFQTASSHTAFNRSLNPTVCWNGSAAPDDSSGYDWTDPFAFAWNSNLTRVSQDLSYLPPGAVGFGTFTDIRIRIDGEGQTTIAGREKAMWKLLSYSEVDRVGCLGRQRSRTGWDVLSTKWVEMPTYLAGQPYVLQTELPEPTEAPHVLQTESVDDCDDCTGITDSLSASEDNRHGLPPKKGFEDTSEGFFVTTGALLKGSDWTTNAIPAHVPESQPTPTPRPPNTEEMEIIASYFNGRPEFRYPGSPPETLPSSGQEASREPTDEEARVIANFLNSRPQLAAQPVVDAEHLGAKSPALIPVQKQDAQVANVAANVLPGPPNDQAVLPTAPRLVLTTLQITISNTPTLVQAYVLTSSVDIIGQVVTYNSTVPITVPFPNLTPTTTLITNNGVVTPSVAYIAAGAMLMNSNEQAGITGLPDVMFAQMTTAINGVGTGFPGYVLSDGSTATIGQTVTLNGTPTVLEPPVLVPTKVSTMVNGVVTNGVAYVLRAKPEAKTTATIGQTVTVDGKTTGLLKPTRVEGPEGDLAVVEGGAARGWKLSWSAGIVGFGTAFVFWL